jgi:DNA-binding NarL/FixJ family response regulator
MSSAQPIRLLIADGHPIVLEGLRSVLGHQPTLQVVGEASDGMEAIEKTVSLDPDIVLMELKLPRVDGLTVLRSIQARAGRSKVILFSSPENKEEFVEAMKLGCSGILSKDSAITLIEKSIQKGLRRRNLAGLEHDRRRDPAIRVAHRFSTRPRNRQRKGDARARPTEPARARNHHSDRAGLQEQGNRRKDVHYGTDRQESFTQCL